MKQVATALVVSLAVFTLVSLVGVAGVVHADEPPIAGTSGGTKIDDYGAVPDFALVERSGRTVTRADLMGRPSVVAFTFSRCQGPCPKIMARMAELSNKLAADDVRFVTITVDPEFDKPEVLEKWSRIYTAGDRWLFLGGDPRAVKSLVMDGFKMSVVEDSKGLIHSLKFAVVDRSGRIRGFYDADEEELVARVRELQPPAIVKKLPPINACLNATSALLLIAGIIAVKKKKIGLHQACMFGAVGVSAAFLGSYLFYHYHHGHTAFPGTGGAKTAYLGLLASHIVLAVAVVPLVLGSVVLGLSGNLERHRRVAKITFPIWLYVSLTGVAVYWILYHVYGAVP